MPGIWKIQEKRSPSQKRVKRELIRLEAPLADQRRRSSISAAFHELRNGLHMGKQGIIKTMNSKK